MSEILRIREIFTTKSVGPLMPGTSNRFIAVNVTSSFFFSFLRFDRLSVSFLIFIPSIHFYLFLG